MTRRPLFTTAVSSLAAILILAAGCSEHGPTGVELQPGTVAASSSVGGRAELLRASREYAAGTYIRVIGRNGGTIEFGVGSLTFPEGALSGPTRITATVDGASIAAEFGPEGLVFPEGREPVLTFDSPVNTSATFAVAYVTGNGVISEVLATFAGDRTWNAGLNHFSKYVLILP